MIRLQCGSFKDVAQSSWPEHVAQVLQNSEILIIMGDSLPYRDNLDPTLKEASGSDDEEEVDETVRIVTKVAPQPKERDYESLQ